MRQQTNRSVFPGAIVLTALWLGLILPAPSAAQGGGEPEKLLVGFWDAPPFFIKRSDGGWEGISIELWEAVARELEVDYELREYASLEKMLQAFEAGEVDLLLGLAGLARHEVVMDLTHSYYQSGSGIAVARARGEASWRHVAGRLASAEFLRVAGLLLLLWLGAGTIVWLLERRGNREMFGSGALRGVGNGIWWAAVTMTTVGYGDKAPRTLAGRTVAIVWMLASIVLISSFTAAITTSLTLGVLRGDVQGLQDLHRVRVGAVADSEGLRILGDLGVAPRVFDGERDALSAVVEGEIDALVHNVLVLRYLARREFPDQVLVLPGTIEPYQVKMAVPSGSPLREPLNRALLEVLNAGEWHRRVQRYLGADH